MSNPVKISAIVLTYNEEAKIAGCLESLRGVADEIVVIDSFSTDKTEEICNGFTPLPRFVKHAYVGYIAQQNYALEVVSYDHVLVLDADERLSENLTKSILAMKQDWGPYPGYSFNRLTNYYGSWLRYGGAFPDVKVRFWDRRLAKWGREDPHGLVAMPLSKTKKLSGDLLHYSYANLGEHIAQLTYYSQQAAKAKYKRGQRANFIINLMASPVFRFVSTYFFRGGFLDGFHGFVYCSLQSYLTLLKYIRLYEYNKNGLPSEADIKPVMKKAYDKVVR